MPKEQALAAKQKEEDSEQASIMEAAKEMREKVAFEEAQKAKGLTKYKGKWMPANEAASQMEIDNHVPKSLEVWTLHAKMLAIERAEIQGARDKIPMQETMMHQEKKSRKEIDAAIKNRKSELDSASRRLDQKAEKLKWLSKKIEATVAAGADEESANELAKSVMEGKISIGMDSETVLYSWGQPNDINKTIREGLSIEQWVYGSGLGNSQYIHFSNGIVVSMTDL